MTDHPRVKALNRLIDGCLNDPAADTEHDKIAEHHLPEKLGRFLDEHSADPTIAEEVWSLAMEDFGARLFRRLLPAGQRLAAKQEGSNTDLDYNKRDLRAVEDLLRCLMVEFINTPTIPRNIPALLGRAANSLRDVREGHRPALFDLPDRSRIPRSAATATTETGGRLAAALDIVIVGGMRLAAAKTWLEEQMREAGLVDAAGNPIRAGRVASWRNNFRKGIGAINAREWFRTEIEENFNQALRRDPDACRDYARKLVRLLATISNRAVRPPLK